LQAEVIVLLLDLRQMSLDRGNRDNRLSNMNTNENEKSTSRVLLASRGVPLFLAVVAASCGAADVGSGAAATALLVAVDPRSVLVDPGQAVAFTATVTGSVQTAVAWSAECGSITSGGLYTASATPGSCQVVATSVADTSKAGRANVTVLPPPPSNGWGAKCAGEALRTTGKTYYACDCQPGADPDCVAGNDASAGTSPSAPVRTWGKALERWHGMNAGDTVALCKGGRFDGSGGNGWSLMQNTRCTASNTCILRDYTPPWASGDEGRPTITISSSGDVTALRIGGGVVVQGYRILNLAFVHTAAGGTGAAGTSGMVMGGEASDVEICNDAFDGFNVGVYVMGFNGGTGSRQHFRGNRITNNCMDGALATTSNSDWDGNFFDNNGHDTCEGYSKLDNPAGGTTHTMYFTCHQQCSGVRFINNQLRRTTVDPRTGTCRQNAVGVAGVTRDVTVENNDWESTTTPGSNCCFLAGGAYDPSQSESNMIVRRNHLRAYEGFAIDMANANGLLIEDNVVTSAGSGAGFWDSQVSLISSPHNTSSPTTTNVTIRNNTIYVTGTTGGQRGWAAIGATNAGSSGANITGNAIYVGPGGSLSACFRIVNKGWLAFMDDNLCAGAASWAFHVSTDTLYPLSGWRSFAGRDASSSTSAPGMVNPAGGDFTPAGGSPLIGAGSTLSTCTVNGAQGQPCSSPVAADVTWDPTRVAQQRAGTPDIGAIAH
jgi:hypothetical protein